MRRALGAILAPATTKAAPSTTLASKRRDVSIFEWDTGTMRYVIIGHIRRSVMRRELTRPMRTPMHGTRTHRSSSMAFSFPVRSENGFMAQVSEALAGSRPYGDRDPTRQLGQAG